MFRNLTLAAKLLVTIIPLIIAIIIITVLDDHYQKEDMLAEAQMSAENYADMIGGSLVGMMISQGKIDHTDLDQLTPLRDIRRVHIHFTVNGLRLRDTFLTDRERLDRLRLHEAENSHLTRGERAVFVTGKPFQEQKATIFHTIIPLKTTAQCQSCHDAPRGEVLGVVELDISLQRIESAVHRNYMRSVAIALFFTGIAIIISILVYRKLVAKRMKNLIQAAHILGTGNLDQPVEADQSNDEIGELRSAFDKMRIQLKSAQEKNIHSERLSIIGQMASSIVHDFKTPMSSINLAIESLEQEKGSIPQRTKQWYRIIRDSIHQMVTMAQELMDFSRGETSLNKINLSVDEFTQMLSESVSKNLSQSKIRFGLHTNYHGNAYFDPDRMHRAINNLITNAQEAMPGGGKIDFTVTKHDHSLIFEVADTGSGIPGEIRDTMYNAFVTAGKKGGTGLGLAITKRIVDQHGGSIEVESERGKGTTFTIKIPID